MSINVIRSADGWWAVHDGRAALIDSKAATTAEFLSDPAAAYRAARELREAAEAREAGEIGKVRQTGETEKPGETGKAGETRKAAGAGGSRAATALVPLTDLAPLSPVTAPCRVVAQMVNYRSHARDSGFGDDVPPTFFRKASGSISGPNDEIVCPAHVRLLDYEVELGLVIGAALPVGTPVTEADLPTYVAGLVVANDVSARDVQLTQGQFYEGKSYPSFTPLGPYLTLLEPGEFDRLIDLRLQLWVNGVPRQDRTLADMIVRPARALTLLARFQELRPGDILLTGTPGGTALKAPPKPVEMLGSLLPARLKWQTFFARAEKNPAYLHDGDLVTARIATRDGALDLGEQRTRVRKPR